LDTAGRLIGKRAASSSTCSRSCARQSRICWRVPSARACKACDGSKCWRSIAFIV